MTALGRRRRARRRNELRRACALAGIAAISAGTVALVLVALRRAAVALLGW